jgi:hypothetical protein
MRLLRFVKRAALVVGLGAAILVAGVSVYYADNFKIPQLRRPVLISEFSTRTSKRPLARPGCSSGLITCCTPPPSGSD